MSIYDYYIPVAMFAIIGIALGAGPLILSRFLRPSKPNPTKSSVYECGELPIGDAWHQYNVQYYLFAIIFVVFDVEVLFLYPWAVVFPDLGILAVIEMVVFIAMLGVGLIYAWKKGALEWV